MKKYQLLSFILALAVMSCKKESIQEQVTPFVQVTVPANSEAISFTGDLTTGDYQPRSIGEGSLSFPADVSTDQTASIIASNSVTIDEAKSVHTFLYISNLSGNGSLTLVYGYKDAGGNQTVLETHSLIFQPGSMTMDGYTVHVIQLNYHPTK
jgi:hypothetical protein